MIRISLRFFARRVLRTKRMDAGDRQTLERVIFSDGVRSRMEAEILLQLASTIDEPDPAWTDFVVAAIVDFVVWGERPTGYVDPDSGRWLVAVLSEGVRADLVRRIAREISAEAQDVDPRLADLARPWWRPRLSWLKMPGGGEDWALAPA
jgi:hypothetical protein